MASSSKCRRGEADSPSPVLSRIGSSRPKRQSLEGSPASLLSTTSVDDSYPRRVRPSISYDLIWGRYGIRTSLLKRLKPSASDAECEDLSNNATDDVIQARKELRQLVDGLHVALSQLDYRRCLLILTYLLHARHLIRADVMNSQRYGKTIAALTYVSHPDVTTCAKTLIQMWRYGLKKEKHSRQEFKTLRNRSLA